MAGAVEALLDVVTALAIGYGRNDDQGLSMRGDDIVQ